LQLLNRLRGSSGRRFARSRRTARLVARRGSRRCGAAAVATRGIERGLGDSEALGAATR
jgi:hypothetical protein